MPKRTFSKTAESFLMKLQLNTNTDSQGNLFLQTRQKSRTSKEAISALPANSTAKCAQFILTEKLKAAGIKCAGFAAELNFLKADKSRSRVSDVIHAVANKELHASLALSPFDILFIDDLKWQAEHYEKTYEKMVEIFGGFDRLNHPVERLNQCELVRPVQMEKGTSSSDIARGYKKWVIKEKAEGLVVHTEQPVIWKIKPLHSIDAAVIF